MHLQSLKLLSPMVLKKIVMDRHTQTDARTERRTRDRFWYEINIPYFSNEKASVNILEIKFIKLSEIRTYIILFKYILTDLVVLVSLLSIQVSQINIYQIKQSVMPLLLSL